MKYTKRLIEVDLPIRVISDHARKDQGIRKGHLHNMHAWWAAKPLASCRAAILATILPDPADPNCPESFRTSAQHILKPFAGGNLAAAAGLRQALLDFVADFSTWEAGIDPTYLSAARSLVAAAHPEGMPLVLDPFAGVGSIPFEAVRVGANAFALDLNPVAILLDKVAIEYLPKYGYGLADGVERWGTWVLQETRKELASYYPADEKGNLPLAHLWARTITCEGPGCGAEVPLLYTLWLSRRGKSAVALRYHGDRKAKQVHVEVFKPRLETDIQSPIVKRMAATCPCCGYTTPYKSVREQLRQKHGGTLGARLLAVIMMDKHGGRLFHLPEPSDLSAALAARSKLSELELAHIGRCSLVPDEPTPECRGPGASRAFSLHSYGMLKWRDLYLPRQALALTTFCRLVAEAHKQIIKENKDQVFADAVATCISLAVSNLTHYTSSMSIWASDGMISAFVQGSGLAMRPDFAEANPLMPKLVGGFEYSLAQLVSVLKREANWPQMGSTAQQGSATAIPLPDESVSYLVTDPPYYDAVPYAALSDLFYVWLKRAIGHIQPGLFSNELTPKALECIMDPGPPAEGGPNKDREYFEETIWAALSEARRTLKPDGVGVVIFAHKSTAGREALLNALVSAGWTVTASWPIDTERAARMRANNSAVLGSSVHLVCRPRENSDGSLGTAEVGDWREVLAELPKRIQEWMPRLSEEGIVGADAIFACLGPALEVFSRYSRVEKASGEHVSLRDYLEYVWASVSQEALRMIFEGADSSGFEEDARLTAMWLWTLNTGNGRISVGTPDDEDEVEGGGKKKAGGNVLESDTAFKLAKGLGANLENLQTVIAVEGETARLLPVSERTAHLFGKAQADAPVGGRKKSRQLKLAFEEELSQAESAGGWGDKGAPRVGITALDRVHQSMILFAAGRGEALRRFLEEGVGREGRFWTLAQALSALYPAGSDEKRWIDGVLARKKGLGF